MTTNYEWAATVLMEARTPECPNGLPLTSVNITNVARWMAGEEPPQTWWAPGRLDPLNANNIMEGDAESFPSLDAAALATAAILCQSNMAGIYAVLRWSGGLWAFSAAVVASPWAAGHYGGNPDYFVQIPAPPPFQAPGTPNPLPAPNPGTMVPMGKPATVAVMNLPGSEKGYWLVAADGGVFAFGVAKFFGSLGGQTLSAPISSAAPMPDGQGYRLVGTDGAVYDFGSAVYEGGTNK